MSSRKPKATRKRMISCFAQIVQEHIPGWKIEEIASGEKVKARRFSYSSQVYLLMLSQFLHLFSLNEIVDVSRIYAPEPSRIRGIPSASLNTFSNANRTRNPAVMQAFFRAVYGFFRREEPDFVKGRHHGRLSKFRLRGIYAIDSTTIQLANWCIDRAKHRQRKAAVKVHMAANVANRLPHFCVSGKAKDHDSRKEDELFGSLKAGDIGIADRAYNNFKALNRQSQRGVFFVVREKSGMKHRAVKKVPKGKLGENIIPDETIRLTGQRTAKEHPGELRRVKARVKVDGKWRTMAFLTNSFGWASSTVADLLQGQMGGRAPVQGTQADAPAPGLPRRERERGRVADMGCAPDPSRPEVAQAQVGRGVQPLALRRARQGHRLAEEGRDGDPALLWDSTSPGLWRHRTGNAVFAGLREDVPEVCGMAERRFAGRWRRGSSHATENGIS